MVYQMNRDLPRDIQSRLSQTRLSQTRLSQTAQEFYRIAFNSALQWYGEEDKAHQIAWSAVRSQSVSLNSVIDGQRESRVASI
jgi:cation transport regulator